MKCYASPGCLWAVHCFRSSFWGRCAMQLMEPYQSPRKHHSARAFNYFLTWPQWFALVQVTCFDSATGQYSGWLGGARDTCSHVHVRPHAVLQLSRRADCRRVLHEIILGFRVQRAMGLQWDSGSVFACLLRFALLQESNYADRQRAFMMGKSTSSKPLSITYTHTHTPHTHTQAHACPLLLLLNVACRSGGLNVGLRELLGHYMALEEVYMEETANMAISIDEVCCEQHLVVLKTVSINKAIERTDWDAILLHLLQESSSTGMQLNAASFKQASSCRSVYPWMLLGVPIFNCYQNLLRSSSKMRSRQYTCLNYAAGLKQLTSDVAPLSVCTETLLYGANDKIHARDAAGAANDACDPRRSRASISTLLQNLSFCHVIPWWHSAQFKADGYETKLRFHIHPWLTLIPLPLTEFFYFYSLGPAADAWPPDLIHGEDLIPGSLTSSMVDDVFFIFRKCALRALTTSSVQVRFLAESASISCEPCKCYEGQRKHGMEIIMEHALACRAGYMALYDD
eukprot:184055-Pelagomonas_calceolata.AAC.1